MTLASPSIAARAHAPLLTRASIVAYRALYAPIGSDWRDPLLSPLFGELEGLPPTLVQTADLDRMWEDYRKAALFCLVYPIVASRGMDLDDPRQRGLVDCMNTRLARAIDELGLADLLS
jgi:hypothetical protein